MPGITSWFARALLALLVAGCGGSKGPAMGAERGPCYGNGTCNAGLECLSNTCVKPAEGGTGGSGGSAGAGGSGGSGGTGGSAGGVPNCTDYCAAITSACTETNAQYTTLAECQAVCPAFPVGTSTDVSGNTLGCRIHVSPAAGNATAASCAAAGPSGGGVCGGDVCVPYCELMLAHCPSSYASMQECMAGCATFQAGSGEYSSAATNSGANAYCYFAFAALSAVDPSLHCSHAVFSSTVCR